MKAFTGIEWNLLTLPSVL